MKHYQHIGLGGTFDHFHVGHKHFLEFAAGFAETLHIGVTESELTQEKDFLSSLEPISTRIESVQNYLKENGISAEVFPLKSVYGPTLENSTVEALAVTEQTVKGGEAINREREKRGLPTLPIHVCSMVRDTEGEVISSTRIRKGEISRRGKLYHNLLQNGISLTEKQRHFFQVKQGQLVTLPSQPLTQTYVVGDVVLDTFFRNTWQFDLGVFDNKTARKTYSISHLAQFAGETFTAKNSPGSISEELFSVLKEKLFSTQTLIQVDGEEDLAAVALVLLAPLGAHIYYGQPGEGIVEMVVTEEKKNQFYLILGSSD